MRKIILIGLITGFLPTFALCGTIGGSVIDWDAQSVSSAPSINVGGFSRFSVQVTYADAAPSASSFTDGAKSSATITVTDYTGVNGAEATATLNFSDNTSAIDDAVITINGRAYTEGVDWDREATSTDTVEGVKDILNAHWEYSAVRTSTAIALTAYTIGTTPNGWTLESSLYTSIATTTWAGGKPYGHLSINSTRLTEGTDWDAETSSDTTSGNIATAINANATLAAIVVATSPANRPGIVEIVSLTNGAFQYPISVSNASYLTPDAVYMEDGAATDISLANDTVTESAHGFKNGLPVLFAVGSGAAPTGLTDGTTYYAIYDTANTFQLSDTSTGAVAGLDLDITAVTGSGTFTATPLAFTAGSMGWKWQASNDGTNWSDVDVSSVTYSADGTDIWNFADFAYKYLRMSFTGPTYGGVDLDAIIFGRDD